MSSVVNIKDGKPMQQPERETWVDRRGQRHFRYTFEYRHDGRDWEFQIWARSEEDAHAKVQSLARNAILVEPQLEVK